MYFKRFLAFALILSLCLGTNSQTTTSVNEWRKLYYINELDQAHKNGIASFIYYLSKQKPSEEVFSKELAAALNAHPHSNNNFRLALIKLFERAFTEAYHSAQTTEKQAVWQRALLEFYKVIHPMLSYGHHTIGYGLEEGALLPRPHHFIEKTTGIKKIARRHTTV
jgi:hypothetical protein